MCEHEELLTNAGYVCIKCGVVLGQEYVHVENISNYYNSDCRNINIYATICTILDHLNLNALHYTDEIRYLIDKYLSNYKCKIELKIGACIYNILSERGLACQLNRISALVCMNVSDTKKLFKLIQIFPQQNVSSNDTNTLGEFLLNHSNFNKEDKCKILQLIHRFSCKFCSYSPVTQIAGISYWYFKAQNDKKKSLKTICDIFLTSQNSVYLYLSHNCTKSWIIK